MVSNGAAHQRISTTEDKEQLQVANAHLSTGMILCRNYPGGCGFCMTYSTLHLPGESKQINDSFKERVEKLVYTTYEWRAEATPLVEREFTNLMLDFPQPGAKRFLEALYHNRLFSMCSTTSRINALPR